MARSKGKKAKGGKIRLQPATVEQVAAASSGKGGLRGFSREALTLLGPSDRLAPNASGMECFRAWDVSISAQRRHRFNETRAALGGKIRTLYHGTLYHNLESILYSGLQPGRAGCMFGSGVYLGEVAKALVYADYGQADGTRFLLEVRVALGRTLVLHSSRKMTLNQLQIEGYHSVAGLAGVTQTYGQGTLQRSEYVVYSPDQVLVTRILEYRNIISTYEAMTTRNPLVRAKKALEGRFCLALVENPIPKKASKLAEVNRERTCGSYGVTPLSTKEGKTVYVCADCMKRLRLKVGDKFRYKNTWVDYAGMTISSQRKRIRSGARVETVTITGIGKV